MLNKSFFLSAVQNTKLQTFFHTTCFLKDLIIRVEAIFTLLKWTVLVYNDGLFFAMNRKYILLFALRLVPTYTFGLLYFTNITNQFRSDFDMIFLKTATFFQTISRLHIFDPSFLLFSRKLSVHLKYLLWLTGFVFFDT